MANPWQAIVCTLVAVASAMPAGGCASGSSDTLRVATLNIAHGRATANHQMELPASAFGRNLATIAGVLKGRSPDIVALQEIDGVSAWSGSQDQVQALGEAAGYPYREHGLHFNSASFGIPIRYGTALLSRQPLGSVSCVEFKAEPLDTKGFLAAEVEFGQRRVLLVSVHLDYKSDSIRARQVKALIDHIRERGLSAVVMGDFNCQWQPGGAARMLADRCNLRAMSPESAGLATYPAGAPRQRIDWILISPELDFQSYEVWPEIVSDHLAVAAELRWRE